MLFFMLRGKLVEFWSGNNISCFVTSAVVYIRGDEFLIVIEKKK